MKKIFVILLFAIISTSLYSQRRGWVPWQMKLYFLDSIYFVKEPLIGLDTAATRGFVRSLSGTGSMVYPDAGIALSSGGAWGSSITNNSANWNTAYGWGDHSIAGYAPLDSPTFTGTVTLPSPFTVGATSVTTSGAELNYLDNVTSDVQTQINLKAALASPTFTGVPAAPTAAPGTNTTQIATTAFVVTDASTQINDTITARLAGGTVGVALADSNKYDGGYATPAWVAANAGSGNADSAKIVTQTMQFIVGKTAGAPAASDSLIISPYFKDKHLRVYVNGDKKYFNTTATNGAVGYRFSDDTITVRPAFSANDQVVIEIDELDDWQTVYIDSLYDGLLAYWNCNESSGSFLNDSHIGGSYMITTGSTGSGGKLGTYAAEFDGNTQYASSSSTDLHITNDEISISMWIYLDQKASTAGHAYNLIRQGGSPQYSLTMSSSDHLDFRVYSIAGIDYQGTQGAKTDWSTSTWYHIVAVAEEGVELKIYVNGVLDKWWSNTYDEGMCDPPAGRVLLGGLSSASSAIDGRIDNVALYDRPLTFDEISDLYNSGSGQALY